MGSVLGSLHCRVGGADVSHVEMLLLYELWVGERLIHAISGQDVKFQFRMVQALMFGAPAALMEP